MDGLEQLQATLRNLNQLALARIRPGDTLAMLDELSRLQTWVGAASRLEEPSSATIEEALLAYRQNKYIKGLRQIRLVCYGCTQIIAGDALIENREYFGKLLKYVDKYANRRRSFRKIYRGLLNSYFSYDPHAPDSSLVGRSNWETLRLFLLKHLDGLLTGIFTPAWLSTLILHPGLLSEYPGLPFEALLLQGDASEFNEARGHLEIHVESWLVREIVMAPFKAVEAMDDTLFKEHLDGLLLLLSDYPLYAGMGLKVLLDRYAQCEHRDIHILLRDFSTGLWGNPWLPENLHQWQCGANARIMLEHWLKRHLLSEFFSLLSDDAAARRMNFWDIYSEEMTGMYFALGKNAYGNENMALYKFRKAAKGLLVRLTEGKPDVHICIMQFEHHHVVEFNRHNNAAYFYDTTQGVPSFYFSKGWLEIGAVSTRNITEGVDVARLSKPLRHQDVKHYTWEGRFAQELGVTESSIDSFCRKYQCSYDDKRNQDGHQWIVPDAAGQYGREVWSVLIGWGFSFSEKAAGYYR
ncbi:MAG: EH signature domain-containing protein [Gallionella sp.]|nr:EH signature domain-containing protein [Gallionella sp.]